MADQELDPSAPPCLCLLSAFLAMEPTDSLVSLARVCGGGSVTEGVQRFIWDHCLSRGAGKFHVPYLKNFLKKLITEVELNHGVVLDELYEQYAYYMTSLKDNLVKGNARVCKCISFLFPDGCFELPSCPNSRKLVVPLQCSLNMLEGDTGCSVWPSSLFLSEFILSFPELFSNKSCFEVGSGVGLVGICLAHVNASKVTLSDGDLLTLMNLKLNLESNNLSIETDGPERTPGDPNMVKCIHLPWESASENELQDLRLDVVLGADIIYDPVCLPHLVRVLAIILNQNKSMDGKVNGINQWNADDNCDGFDSKVNGANQGNPNADCDGFDKNPTSNSGSREGHMAYIAFIIRNTNTFNQFLSLVGQANFTITDLTETHKLMPFPFPLYDLLEQSLPLYNMLRCHVKQTSCLLKSPLPPPDLPVPANEKLLAWVGDKILPCDSGKIKKAIFSTLIRCGMFDNAHIRLSLTCGKKVTSGMNPAFNLYGCTLIGSPRDQGSQPPQMVFWVGNSLEF